MGKIMLVDLAAWQNITRKCICKDCGGKLVGKGKDRASGKMKIECVDCGPEFSGWVSREAVARYEAEESRRIDEVMANNPEWERKPMKERKTIKTLRGNKLAFPEIGQIRKGEMQEFTRADKSTYKRPVDLDYFRVVFKEGEEKASAKFWADYVHTEENPLRDINIRFPSNSIGDVWSNSLVGFLAGGLVAESDGETYSFIRDGITGEVLVRNGYYLVDHPDGIYKRGEVAKFSKDVPATWYEKTKGGKTTKEPVYCEPSGLLRVMVPELERAAVLTVVTNSWNDIESIDAFFDKSYDFLEGHLMALPMVLKRRKAEVSTPGKDGKRVRREKWLIQLEIEETIAARRMKQLEDNIFNEPVPVLDSPEYPALPAGDEVVDVPAFDHAAYSEHTSGELLEGEISGEIEEEAPAEVDHFQVAIEAAEFLKDSPAAVGLLFVEKLKITKVSVFERFCARIGIDPKADAEMIKDILAGCKDGNKFDYNKAAIAVLKQTGWFETGEKSNE